MTDQEHARAIAEQRRTIATQARTIAAQLYPVVVGSYGYEPTDAAVARAFDVANMKRDLAIPIIVAALSVTADTARAQAFEDAATVIDQRIQQEKQRLEKAYKLPYNVRAIDARNAVTDALTAAAVELRARATPGDTP